MAYIPSLLTEKKGVIRSVDTSYFETELLQIIKSDVVVKRVQRLNKVTRNENEVVHTPRQVVIVTFKGVKIPQYVFINRVRCPVDVYIPSVVQCFGCLRFGHIATQCKSKKRCRKCAAEVVTDCAECDVWCVFCRNNNHASTDKSCPEYGKQKESRKPCHTSTFLSKKQKLLLTTPVILV